MRLKVFKLLLRLVLTGAVTNLRIINFYLEKYEIESI